MSSSEEEGGIQSAIPQKRTRACDVCRKKKVRCNALSTAETVCSNCVASGVECTYHEVPKRQAPSRRYVAGLEHRVQGLERVIRRLCPDDETYEKWLCSLEEGSEEHILSPRHRVQPPTQVKPGVLIDRISRAIRFVGTDSLTTLDDQIDSPVTAEDLSPTIDRFFGKSSGESLVRTAINMRNEWEGSRSSVLCNRREEFWTIRPWERKPEVSYSARYTFPDPDLSTILIELFFQHINLYLPLLHRASFHKSVQDGLHRYDDDFAAVYLTVCAIGSRFLIDPRVLSKTFNSYQSAGWKWYNQVESMKTTFLSSPTLYNLQFYCLSVIFLQSSSAPSSVWTMVGIAIRSAQDVGVHRRKASANSLENELWKRAFWVLLCLDRTISVSVGRPCAIQEEDYDVDMPIDCDDEFLDHPDVEQRFKQPARKPSLTSAFILQIRLMQILIYCIRGIYSLSSTNWRLGLFGQKWKFHIVAELDSSLNKWLDSVPDHLRWDPDRQTDNFFNQSAMLYAIYYHVRILVHRSFIPLPGRPSPLTIPSLAICTNAARACCDVVYTLLQRNTLASLPALQVATLSSAIIMLFNIWLEKPPGLGISLDGNSDLESVHKCMQVLKAAEERWHMAGRFWDLLHELSSVRDPLPSTQTEQAGKLLVSTEQDGHGVPPQAEVVATELTDHGSPCDYRSSTHCLTEGGNATPRTHQSSTEPLQLRPFDYDCPPSSVQHQLEQIQLGSPSEGLGTASLLEDTTDTTAQYNTLVQAPLASCKAWNLKGPFNRPWTFQPQVPIRHISRNGSHARESQQPQANGTFSDEVMDMWSDAPTGFGPDDWDMYLGGFPNVDESHWHTMTSHF